MESRKNLRLKGFDYNQEGIYFITICTKDRVNFLGRVAVGGGVPDAPFVLLSEYGKIVLEQIEEMTRVYSGIDIPKYVIMPNHIHLLISLNAGGPSGTPAPTNARIPALISVFKRFTNQKCGISLWQRSYHDHVIRDDTDYLMHWQYIDSNPAAWTEDEYFSE